MLASLLRTEGGLGAGERIPSIGGRPAEAFGRDLDLRDVILEGAHRPNVEIVGRGPARSAREQQGV